jgi:hypothetical protein
LIIIGGGGGVKLCVCAPDGLGAWLNRHLSPFRQVPDAKNKHGRELRELKEEDSDVAEDGLSGTTCVSVGLAVPVLTGKQIFPLLFGPFLPSLTSFSAPAFMSLVCLLSDFPVSDWYPSPLSGWFCGLASRVSSDMMFRLWMMDECLDANVFQASLWAFVLLAR